MWKAVNAAMATRARIEDFILTPQGKVPAAQARGGELD